MSSAVRPGTLPAQVSSARSRAGLLKRLRGALPAMHDATLKALGERHPWFETLDEESQSWISLLTRKGIDGFLTWFSGEEFAAESVFAAAPQTMTGRITLAQTVELVRTSTDIVEEQVHHLLPRGDRGVVMHGIMHYSRELAFAAATVYAKAAEARGAWDTRIEASVVDAIVRQETTDQIISRASTFGWDTEAPVAVAMMPAPNDPGVERVRHHAGRLGLETLAAPQGSRLVCIFAGDPLADLQTLRAAVAELEPEFPDGPIVIGPIVDNLAEAQRSARAAASGYRAAPGWQEGPRTLLADELLPERALAGDNHARRILAHHVYGSLANSKELLETCIGFLDAGSSMEAAARVLYVHPNTVRYRIKRIQEITGYNPTDSRDAYFLRMAVTLGRLQPAS